MQFSHAVDNTPAYEQAGADVYAVSSGHQAGPWTVRNLLLEPQTSSKEGIQPYTLLVEVDDVPGVLNEVTGVIARRGYNIQSLAVGNSEKFGRSRITMVLPGQSGSISKLIKQLMKLIVVQEVVDVTDVPHVKRELILVKVWHVRACFVLACCAAADGSFIATIPRWSPYDASVRVLGTCPEDAHMFKALCCLVARSCSFCCVGLAGLASARALSVLRVFHPPCGGVSASTQRSSS